MRNVNIKIDGIQVSVPGGSTILEAAKAVNIFIPTLCYLRDVNEIGCCRMCLVETKGGKALQAACVTPVSEGMEIFTHSPKVVEARKVNLELILSNHVTRCQTCSRSWIKCELQTLANKLGVQQVRFEGEAPYHPQDVTVSIVRYNNKCILCRRCVSVCKNRQTVGVIDAIGRGFNTVIGSPFGRSLADTPCVNCGQCVNVCPVGALHEKTETDVVWQAINDPEMHVVVQTAPAVRAALGESFGMPIGTAVTGKMITALRMIGFDKVFDTDTAADLTIMEEANELIDRVRSGGKMPMITSCSPGWIKFCEHYFPEFLDNLSTCKSPHMMFGSIIKTYYAKKAGIDPKKIFTVSVMPCTAKKFEAKRPEMEVDGLRDVDAVITTRELADMIYDIGIDFPNLPDDVFDDPFGNASGAGVIFGATGGVMEAALRTATDILSGTSTDNIEYEEIRGFEGIKLAECTVGEVTLRAAVAHGLGNARKLLNKIKAGEIEVDFIEIMACPNGCINGGGQPIQSSDIRNWSNVSQRRAEALYREDRGMYVRKSHNNPAVKRLYKDFLGMAGVTLSHKLLHTHYHEREKYPENV